MHHLHQSTHIRHPLPQQNTNPQPMTYNPSICHSPSTSFQVTPIISQNLNYLCIFPNSAPTFNATQSHPSYKSWKNTYPNKINTTKAKQKNKNNNKKPYNFKPRFQPIEHPLTSPPYTATPPLTTATQYNPPILKTTATQSTHPTLKTTGTQYILPIPQNHSSTHTKSQHLPPYEPNTHIHRNRHTDLHHQIIITHSNIAHPYPHLHSYSHSKLDPIYHTTYHPNQLTKLSQIPHQRPSTSAPQTSHTHQQRKPTLINTTQLPQHPSHNTRHKHNKNFNILQHRHNQTNTIKPQQITTSTNNIVTTSHPMPLLFHREINPAMMELLLQRGNQSRYR